MSHVTLKSLAEQGVASLSFLLNEVIKEEGKGVSLIWMLSNWITIKSI